MKGLFLAVAVAAALAIWTLNARADFRDADVTALTGTVAHLATVHTSTQR